MSLRIKTIKDLKRILNNLNDNDEIVIETIDLDTEDTQDLYPMSVDVIDVSADHDGSYNEVRFCQMPQRFFEKRNTPFYRAEMFFSDGARVLVAMMNDLQEIKEKSTDTMKFYKNGGKPAFYTRVVSHIEISKVDDLSFKPIKIN
jgi:hypothetical protein